MVVRHGRFRLFFGEALERAKKDREMRENKWRRINRRRMSRVPAIQEMLWKAHQYDFRLKANPNLTRTRLAAEIGIAPSFLTRILRLVNLAPKIQDHIKQMPASPYPCPITGSRLRALARSEDYGFQLSEFNRLINLNSEKYSVPILRGTESAFKRDRARSKLRLDSNSVFKLSRPKIGT